MKRHIRILSVMLSLLIVSSALVQAEVVEGTLSSGARYIISVPDGSWNGDLVMYAHGYTSPIPEREPDLPLSLPDGTPIPALVNGLGYAFAASSFPKNGLAVVEGIDDMVELSDVFESTYGTPGHIYLGGASMGGLVTVLAIERHPTVFDGGLAVCGPVGNFRKQIDYFGDFRVVFDYFFPGVIPGSPIQIPEEVMANWETVYVGKIITALVQKPGKTKQLLRVTRAAVDPEDPDSIAETVLGVLWYNVFATNDARTVLGGNPYDNRRRWYFGSKNDLRLNWRVKRFSADPAALAEMEMSYKTSGVLLTDLVTAHTTADPIVPYWHEILYWLRTLRGSPLGLHTNLPISRYGHCQLTQEEFLFAFGLLVWKVEGSFPQSTP
jgi:hypothetical protein